TPIRAPLTAAWSKDSKTIVWTAQPDTDGDVEEGPALQHAFNLAELTLMHGGRRKAKDSSKDLQRAVLHEKGATLNVDHEATVVHGKEKVKFISPFGVNTCGTLLPGDRAVLNNIGGGLQLLDTKTGK